MIDKELLQAMSELLDAKLEPIDNRLAKLETMDKSLAKLETMDKSLAKLETMDNRLAKLEVLIETETNRNIQLLAEGYLPMVDKMNKIADIVEDTKLTVDIIEKVVVKHSYEINKLKKSS